MLHIFSSYYDCEIFLCCDAKIRVPPLQFDTYVDRCLIDEETRIGAPDIFSFAKDSEKHERYFTVDPRITPRETSAVMRHCRVTRRASRNATVVHHCRGNIKLKSTLIIRREQ